MSVTLTHFQGHRGTLNICHLRYSCTTAIVFTDIKYIFIGLFVQVRPAAPTYTLTPLQPAPAATTYMPMAAQSRGGLSSLRPGNTYTNMPRQQSDSSLFGGLGLGLNTSGLSSSGLSSYGEQNWQNPEEVGEGLVGMTTYASTDPRLYATQVLKQQNQPVYAQQLGDQPTTIHQVVAGGSGVLPSQQPRHAVSATITSASKTLAGNIGLAPAEVVAGGLDGTLITINDNDLGTTVLTTSQASAAGGDSTYTADLNTPNPQEQNF